MPWIFWFRTVSQVQSFVEGKERGSEILIAWASLSSSQQPYTLSQCPCSAATTACQPAWHCCNVTSSTRTHTKTTANSITSIPLPSWALGHHPQLGKKSYLSRYFSEKSTMVWYIGRRQWASDGWRCALVWGRSRVPAPSCRHQKYSTWTDSKPASQPIAGQPSAETLPRESAAVPYCPQVRSRYRALQLPLRPISNG